MKELNLCELLKGHEGKIFYSPAFGHIELLDTNPLTFEDELSNELTFNSNGKYNERGTCMVFPSENQKDWNKWVEEQKPKVPKTWSELMKQPHPTIGLISVFEGNEFFHPISIEKSALALIKIHQLIEVGYGGNIIKAEWKGCGPIYTIEHTPGNTKPFEIHNYGIKTFNHIAFHKERQAKEFLSHPENVQLLKDFYML